MGINLLLPGWRESKIYPGTHWLYYNKRGHYRARVDFASWTKGKYQWRVMNGYREDDIGWEATLEEAKHAAEEIMAGKPYQMKLLV